MVFILKNYVNTDLSSQFVDKNSRYIVYFSLWNMRLNMETVRSLNQIPVFFQE